MDQTKQNVVGAYALVTGSGAGLGMAFAKELASRGYNLVMVSLQGEYLEQKAQAISTEHQVDVLYLEKDLSDEQSSADIAQFLLENHIHLHVLVNNAGIGSTNPFLDFPPAFYVKQLKVNVITPVLLIRMILEDMLSFEHKCYILNVGSLGGYFHLPNKEVYGASKAFVHSFTNALQLRVKGTNVSVTVISPGPVETNERIQAAHKNMKGLAKRAVMIPEEVAEQALDAMFAQKKKFIPGKINRLFLLLDWLVPTSVKNKILWKEMKRQASFTK